MRIAMISTPFVEVPPPRYGGTELVVYELVEGLLDRGHQVTLFAPGGSRTRADLRSIYAQPRWPPDPLSDLNHTSWAMQAAATGGFDLIHTHCAPALAIGRLLPPEIPLVYTLHHHREENLSEYYEFFPEVHYVAISHDQRSRETSLPRITVIPHGLDPQRYEWRKSPAEHVCFLGRFSSVKGPHAAIDAAREAGVPIQVAGEAHDVDQAYFQREVRPRLGLGHVRHLGPVGTDGKIPLLRDARALLAPIEWNEPFGLVFAEAMLCGCPVVAYPRGSVPELVEEGVTGFIVRDVHEMARLIRPGGPLDSFDRARCRQRAVERFNSDTMVEAHDALYRRAAAERLVFGATASDEIGIEERRAGANDDLFDPVAHGHPERRR